MKWAILFELNANDMENDTRYMTMALAEAQKALAMGEVPIGCVIVADGQVVGRGHNLTETLQDVTAHAECKPSRRLLIP